MNKPKKSAVYILIFFLLFYVGDIYAAEVSVISVHDGDTITVKSKNGKKTKIRLYGIDAPELTQPYGKACRKKLISLINGKKLSYKNQYKDNYGRSVAELFNDNKNINLQMVKDGFAWHYKHFSKSETLAKAEEFARKNKLGLWKDQKPTPPWDYRRKQKGLPNYHNKPLFKLPIKGIYWCIDPESFDSSVQTSPCPRGIYTAFGS